MDAKNAVKTLPGPAADFRLKHAVGRLAQTAPPQSFFVASAVFHYLGPAFAVLLFARVEPLGVAWLRIVSAGAIFALWRKPWRGFARLDNNGRRTVLAMGATLAVMNCVFYSAIARLPLSTVAAIEFLPVIALAAAGARTVRNGTALVSAVAGVYVLTHIRVVGQPLGIGLAFANAALFALYIVLAHRVAQARIISGIDSLGAAMLIASVVVTPIGGWFAAPAFLDPVAIGAGIGVGISSSVIPYVFDQLAMARMRRATYALFVSLLPATATVVGIVVLAQLPSWADVLGVALVIAAIAAHRESDIESADESIPTRRSGPIVGVPAMPDAAKIPDSSPLVAERDGPLVAASSLATEATIVDPLSRTQDRLSVLAFPGKRRRRRPPKP